ncbi:hypothetical protein ABE571_04425 [Stenotrophomonas sp. TWI273]|uniref:hypothetical protein n=1 Tax=Stenotrophomonas sp. TWI273 TaxID=3136774 RepID=UPI003207A85C
MSSLLNESYEAQTWAQEAIKRHPDGIHGKIIAGVAWTDARAEDGALLVEGDPDVMLEKLQTGRIPLMKGHDPGRPMGNVLDAALFQTTRGERFIAVVLGIYESGIGLTFADLGLDRHVAADRVLPEPDPGASIEIAYDPREVSEEWVAEIEAISPLGVVRTPLSHNAAESVVELLRIGLPYALIVWNPVAKSFGAEVGKALYGSVHAWLKRTIETAKARKDPLLSLEAHQNGCHVMFLIRGNDLALNQAAHEGLSQAAVQAAQIIDVLIERGIPAHKLVYEMDREQLRWFPSYAVLDQGRLITNTATLIAAGADLPAGLSLGFLRDDIGDSKQN